MNANDREELARLLPAPAERDLPGDRHHQLQEFVMSEIQRDPRVTAAAPRRPLMRRSVLVASALTAVAAVAAAIGIAATGQSGDGPVPPGPVPPGRAPQSGQELLLAAANTALRQPAGTGRYWHVKVVTKDAAKKVKNGYETWSDRDGVNWILFADSAPDPSNPGGGGPGQGPRTTGKPMKWGDRGFSVCSVYITFTELQNLPTAPDALKAAIARIHTDKDAPADQLEERVLYGLIALVSQLPAPPAVRAAAFQAIAAYPGVVNLGPVDGGVALRISQGWGPDPARLVIDPVAAQIRETDVVVVFNQVTQSTDGGSSTITAGWTDSLPG
jgi:hypothetical protein